jgi:hypothetical protein
MISEQALQEFMAIWHEEKGEEISREEANDEAVNLLTFVNAIYHPIKKEWLEEFLKVHPQKNDYEKPKRSTI